MIFVLTQLRRGDEVPDVAAFTSLAAAQRSAEATWALKQQELHGDDDDEKEKIVWHGVEGGWFAQEEDDGDGDNETFRIDQVTLQE